MKRVRVFIAAILAGIIAGCAQLPLDPLAAGPCFDCGAKMPFPLDSLRR